MGNGWHEKRNQILNNEYRQADDNGGFLLKPKCRKNQIQKENMQRQSYEQAA